MSVDLMRRICVVGGIHLIGVAYRREPDNEGTSNGKKNPVDNEVKIEIGLEVQI
jgi:hypothetical protein